MISRPYLELAKRSCACAGRETHLSRESNAALQNLQPLSRILAVPQITRARPLQDLRQAKLLNDKRRRHTRVGVGCGPPKENTRWSAFLTESPSVKEGRLTFEYVPRQAQTSDQPTQKRVPSTRHIPHLILLFLPPVSRHPPDGPSGRTCARPQGTAAENDGGGGTKSPAGEDEGEEVLVGLFCSWRAYREESCRG